MDDFTLRATRQIANRNWLLSVIGAWIFVYIAYRIEGMQSLRFDSEQTAVLAAAGAMLLLFGTIIAPLDESLDALYMRGFSISLELLGLALVMFLSVHLGRTLFGLFTLIVGALGAYPAMYLWHRYPFSLRRQIHDRRDLLKAIAQRDAHSALRQTVR